MAAVDSEWSATIVCRRGHRQGDADRVVSVPVNEEHSEMCALRIKRELALTLLVSLVVLCGCAHHYLMKLSNGDQTISVSKPELLGTNYHFTGTDRVGCVIPRSRVVKIKTISAEEQQEKPSSPPKPNKPKHWYYLWLA
jgi:hypothetical protein